MEDRDIGAYLSRIMCGYYLFIYADKKYKLEYPSIELKYEAEILAEQMYQNCKFEDWPTLRSVVDILVEYGLWEYHFEMDIKRLEKNIEDLKIEIFKSYLNDKKLKQLKRTLYQNERRLNDLFTKKHLFDHITIEGFVDSVKSQFLLSRSILNENNEKIFCDENANQLLLQKISAAVSSHAIDVITFRKIARSNLWMNYWGTKREDVFNGPSINWTDEQKTLVRVSKMYDSAREHPECPPDDVFDDDDAFDGWMISERRKSEKTRIENRLEKNLPKSHKNSGEVFIMAGSQKEAEQIYELNDSQTRGIIKERNKVINSTKKIDDTNLPDVRRNITIQNNELTKNQARNR